MAQHNELGKAGELAAVHYLLERDYHILERNWICHPLEIDIIAEEFGEIVFVEVKTRRTTRWEDPEAAVDRRKQEHLFLAARAYLQKKRLVQSLFRFDIITLVGSAPPFDLRHFKNVFPLRPSFALHPHDHRHRFV